MNKPRILESGIVDVKFGVDVCIVNPVNLYRCTLEDGVRVGPFVEIQSNVRVGRMTKIQSHSFVCENVEIGENCFIGHGVVFINDKFSMGGPACGDRSLWENTKIGNNVSLGSNVTLLPVEICDNVVIGAGSVVTKNIDRPGTYAGNPARLISEGFSNE